MTFQSPPAGDGKLRSKSARKPLQPKNSPGGPTNTNTHQRLPKPKQELVEISSVDGDSNKENQHYHIYATPTKVVKPLDSSLADELSAIKKKLERLRIEKEKTEKMLQERETVLDLQMKEIEQRGVAQKELENEVDRLFRLKELLSYSLRISPIRSLREKAHGKQMTQVHFLEMEAEDLDETAVGRALPSPSPSPSYSWGSNSISSPLVAVK